MSQMQQRVINVISKPSRERGTQEIDLILPWLRKKSPLMQSLEKEVIVDIIRKCQYEKASRDDVIIRQGDTGECFYVILSGTVSVFIDATKSGEDRPEDLILPSEGDTCLLSPPPRPPRRVTDRSTLGRFVIKFESGRTFGEVALMTEESARNASIVADEEVDLLVIHKDLYNETLKAYQEQEYEDRREFVNNHPLFGKWSARFRRLLEMSLIKEIYTYDTPIYHQGEPLNGLAFIRRGRAKVTMAPGRHEHQYRHLAPFPTQNDIYELELNRPKKKHKKKQILASLRQDQVRVRRLEGYSEAERRVQHRSIILCHVEEGEILGDVELVMGLETYMQSVICTSYTEVYKLTSKNYDRLISKRYPQTVDVLRLLVETKIGNRAHTLQGGKVPLLQHIQFKLTQELKPKAKKSVTIRTSKGLPDRETLFRHLLETFVEDKAPMLEPYVAGAVYYREMMRGKANLRENIRKNNNNHYPSEVLYRTKRKLKREKGARTLIALRADLQRQLDDTKDKERAMLLKNMREKEIQQLERDYQSHLSQNDKMEMTMKTLPVLPAIKDQSVLNKGKGLNNNYMMDTGIKKSPTLTPGDVVLDEGVKAKPPDMSEPEPEAKRPLETRSNPEAEQDTTGTKRGIKSALPSLTLEKEKSVFITETIIREDYTSEETNIRNSVESVVNSVELARVPAVDIKETGMQFVNPYVRKRLVIEYENPMYRDWETSDKTLGDLEERMRKFASQFDDGKENAGIIEPLKRFERGDEFMSQPKRGGRVLIKRRSCVLAGLNYAGTNHSHTRYHMVKNIPQYEQLRQCKMIQQFHMDRL